MTKNSQAQCDTGCNTADQNTHVKTITLGCRFNYYESELERMRILAENPDQDVVIINTCTVTHEAERQSKQAVRKAIRENPRAKVIVTGCAAKTSYEYFRDLDGVHKIIQNDEKTKFDAGTLQKSGRQLFEDRTRAFLQIQNGCNHHCSYCIIPYTRGKSQSLPIEFIVEQIKYFCSVGINEIVLSGIDIMSYGDDFQDKKSLADVMETIINQTEAQRLRISSIDPNGIDDRLFALITQEKRIMPNLHLSIQSGDNDVLRKMRRRHTREDVIDLCNRILDARSDFVFGSDFIVGFPSETDECFGNTVKLVHEAHLSLLHVFPFSPRKNTVAAQMIQLPRTTINSRAKILRDVAQDALSLAMTQNIGQTRSCIIEKCDDGVSVGKTDNYLPVKVKSRHDAPAVVPCKLLSIDDQDNVLLGEFV